MIRWVPLFLHRKKFHLPFCRHNQSIIVSYTVKMPISKKARIQREHKAAEKAGTRIPHKPNGLPVKPPKPTSICKNCRKEIVNTNKAQLEVHAGTHDAKLWPKEKCWPNDFPAA
ncbi:uncharacterized protein LY79DRAFT_563726 [Colletotrichum navitas]|uniref:Uncharacterized protein n=1 Tax=Colletotrichum navitas TaxID=681940 RepID=A0AAD8V1B6_9PEZI|nr:uncharacterized protein LY79DRAFT_563726 [Colletotrichum navitas]KAK1579577.1 hypothetical protein LY79DRAFT_563726 [Colletotrichum navitas]